MHDFSGMADAGGMGYPPSPLIGPWPRVFGCGAGVFKHQPFALLVCSIQGPRVIHILGFRCFFFFAYKYLYTCLAGTPAQPYSHKG